MQTSSQKIAKENDDLHSQLKHQESLAQEIDKELKELQEKYNEKLPEELKVLENQLN